MRLAVLFIVLTSTYALAADSTPNPVPAPDPNMQAAMEQMGKTGAEHAALAKAVGEWDVASTMWMTPNAAPTTSKGSATFTSELNGKWIRQDYRGDMMGKPFRGVGMSGYDTIDKHYVCTWCDDSSTVMTMMTGESKDGGKTITYTSEMKYCPMTGGPLKNRYVYNQESPDRILFTIYETPQGNSERKSMELVYTRKKATR